MDYDAYMSDKVDARNASKKRINIYSFKRNANDTFINHLKIGDYDFDLNYKPMKNPAELLEQLIPIRENDKLTNEGKIKMVRKIVTRYME